MLRDVVNILYQDTHDIDTINDTEEIAPPPFITTSKLSFGTRLQ